MHEGHLTVRDILDDVRAVLPVGCVGAEERAQDGSCCGSVFGFFREFEGNFIDQTFSYS
jgi:hypothetical protein